MAVNHRFHAAIELAIRDYENLFDTKALMPERRSKDVMDLRDILSQEDLENESFREALRRRITEIKTWFLMPSRLRGNVSSVLEAPEFSEINLLREDLTTTIAHYRSELAQVVRKELPETIRDQLQQKEVLIAKQAQEIEGLEADVGRLEAELVKAQSRTHELEALNQRLLERTQALMVRNAQLQQIADCAMGNAPGSVTPKTVAV